MTTLVLLLMIASVCYDYLCYYYYYYYLFFFFFFGGGGGGGGLRGNVTITQRPILPTRIDLEFARGVFSSIFSVVFCDFGRFRGFGSEGLGLLGVCSRLLIPEWLGVNFAYTQGLRGLGVRS